MNKRIIIMLFTFCLFLILINFISAINYTVCSSGCNTTNISDIFINYDLEAGDLVEVQADTPGGSKIYNESIAPPNDDSGNTSNQVILTSKNGDNITINGNSSQYAISFQTGNYFTVKDFTIIGGTNNPGSDWGIFISSKTGIRIENIIGYGQGNSQYGVRVSNSINVSIINVSLYNFQGPGFSVSGASTQNVSFINCSDNASQDSFSVEAGVSNLTLMGFISADADRYGINSAANISTYNSNISKAGVEGFRCSGKCVSYRDIVYNNSDDGFHVTGGGTFIIYYGTSYNNGAIGSSNSGDGYTAHAGDNMTLYYCIGYDNLNTGMGMATGSQGVSYNSVFYNNGIGLPRQSNIWINGGNWSIKNNIAHSAESYESYITSDALSEGSVLNFQNNLYGILNAFKYGASNVTFNTWKINISGDNDSINSNPLFVDSSIYNFSLSYTSPAIDTGINVGLTTDFLGNPIYGTPDIGAFEYQPPYNISAENINTTISKDIRIYLDGKFRYINSSALNANINLTILPKNGFNGTSYSQWMDLNITNWNLSFMNWTEIASGIGITNHTVCNVSQNAYYELLIDGLWNASLINGSDSCLFFQYTGGYSVHDFIVRNDTFAPNITINALNASQSFTSGTVVLNVTIDQPGTCIYSKNSVNNSMDTSDNLTFIKTLSLSNADYIIIFYCNDTIGNLGNINVSFTVSIPSNDLSGSSSSSSGGGSTSSWGRTFVASSKEFADGYLGQLKNNQRVKFKFNEKYHHVGVKELTNETALIVVESEPQEATLAIDESKYFELDGDEFYDVYVKLNDIQEGKAILTIRGTHMKIETPKEDKDEEPEQEKQEETIKEKIKEINPEIFWSTLIAIIGILSIIGLVIAMRKHYINLYDIAKEKIKKK